MTGHSRFVSSLSALLAGALIVIGVFAFRTQTAAWLTFALSAAVLGLVLMAFAARGRGTTMRVLDVMLMLVAAWAVVASRVFGAAHLVRWLGVAEGSAIGGPDSRAAPPRDARRPALRRAVEAATVSTSTRRAGHPAGRDHRVGSASERRAGSRRHQETGTVNT